LNFISFISHHLRIHFNYRKW